MCATRRPIDDVRAAQECTFSFPLPHCQTAPAAARRAAASVLDDWGVADDTRYDALVVISELVTNAVEHALPPVALHMGIGVDTELHINVSDGGPSEARGAWTASCAAEERGRGRQVIAALSESAGTADGDHWATVGDI
ncbi:ATP-binding protein [Streptomyces sp. NPDC008343]|uniref:ATP-binding protein n=1 Tax=Streptomyces sp. NPDC008343 TaxID=3364828 RepID=UPI0036EAC43A